MTHNSVQMPFIAFLFLLSFILPLQAQDTHASTGLPTEAIEQVGSVTTVKIGLQEWATKNLDVVTFRNGDTIPEAQTYEEWREAGEKGQPAWCNQANLPKYGQKYGKLYNWYAVNDPRGLAPKGYHVPSKAEWDSLVSYLGGEQIAGKKLKSTEGWREEGNGTNESGFSGFPGASRDHDGAFTVVGGLGNWWSSGELGSDRAWYFTLTYKYDFVFRSKDGKPFGFFVRCLRD